MGKRRPKIKVGDKVNFTDPDGGIADGEYEVKDMYSDMYLLSNGFSEVECYEHEIERV